MPFPVINASTQVLCPHGGKATLTGVAPRVIVGGAPALTAAGAGRVPLRGCALEVLASTAALIPGGSTGRRSATCQTGRRVVVQLLPPPPVPCVAVLWNGSPRVLSAGAPLLRADGMARSASGPLTFTNLCSRVVIA